VIKGYLASLGIVDELITEHYVGPAFADWSALVGDIRRFAKRGQVAVIATITGDANLQFFR